MQLGVNIDHVATLRQARGTFYPDPIAAAQMAQAAGADNITLHLREDRRHIQDRDVYLLKKKIGIPINLEIALTPEMLDIAEEVRPQMCCLVPEKRQELTTEGGLNVLSAQEEIYQACQRLAKMGIEVSLFIDPDLQQIQAALACKVPAIELHTGRYAEEQDPQQQRIYLQQIQQAAAFAHSHGLQVHAGHGLHYQNVIPVAQISEIHSLMIGHAIISQAVFTGMDAAVREMKQLLLQATL